MPIGTVAHTCNACRYRWVWSEADAAINKLISVRQRAPPILHWGSQNEETLLVKLIFMFVNIVVTFLCWIVLYSCPSQVESGFSRRICSRLTGPRQAHSAAWCPWICTGIQLNNSCSIRNQGASLRSVRSTLQNWFCFCLCFGVCFRLDILVLPGAAQMQ